MDAGNIPEEYYSYLENWYRSQVSAHITDTKTGSAPALHTALSPPFSLQPLSSGGAPSSLTSPSPSVSSPASSLSGSVFIPVSTLQNLRASLPAQLPQISGGAETSWSSLSQSSSPLPRLSGRYYFRL